MDIANPIYDVVFKYLLQERQQAEQVRRVLSG